MSKKRRKKGALVLLCIMIIVCVILYLILFHLSSSEAKVVDEIKGYGYTLDDRDTQLMRDTFNELKLELDKSEIDYKKYAEYLSQLFIIDLYTIDNKVNKYDVGGTEYIYPEHISNYKLKVEDTLYRYLEENSSRKDKMPVVSEITLKGIKEDTYEYNDNKYDSYILELAWEYEKDLGYDKAGIITVIKADNKLYVSEYTTEVSE